MKPWFYHKSREEVKEFLVEILNGEKGVKIHVNEENYIHAVYTIPIMKFKDDLEFFLPESTNIIHFRSASRVGYSDLGVNKRRLRRIQKKLSNSGIITI